MSGPIALLPSAGSSLRAFLLSASPLLLVVLDLTKPFYIGKSATSANLTTVTKILKGTIWIAKILFLFLNKAWQYMLGILDFTQYLKVAEDVTYWQVLAAENIGYKYETMIKL